MHPDKFLGRSNKEQSFDPDEKASRLLAISKIIADKRKEAVDGRKNSGIETTWMQCEEQHFGIDDLNRHEFSDAKWCKPTSMVGPLTSQRFAKDESRSNVFVRVTSRYVFGAEAKLSEIILPIDDKAFSLDATPDPDLVKQAADLTPIINQMTGQQVMRQPTEVEQQMPAPQPAPQAGQQPQQVQPPAAPTATPAQSAPPQPTAPGGAAAPVTMTAGDIAQQQIDQEKEAAKKAETRIFDWMVEGNYACEARKVIHDAARCGVGVLKGPFPDYKKAKAVTKMPQGVAFQMRKKVLPSVKWVDFWNLYPDAACGEDVHEGSYIFERDYLTEKLLKALKDQDGYLSDQIERVIQEGPGRIYADGKSPNDTKDEKQKRYEIWYYHGVLDRKDMELLDAVGVEDLPDDMEEVHAIVSLVNDTVIKAIINPLDSGNFPYRVFSWSRRPGHWAGVGVAEQMRAAQSMVNAATRALLNNAGLSAGPQIIIDQAGMIPADNSWKLYPNKIWYKTGDTGGNVNEAFASITIPSVQKEMQAIIDYAMKMAEESTGIPLITQGQTGPSSPETFGAAELQDNNAHTWLRSIAERFDDQLTEPLVDDYYEWLLLDPEVPDDEKGDFTINAKGSTAMVERAIQEQFYMTLLNQVAQPAFQLNPEKLMAQLLKSKRLDPRDIQYSKEEQQQQAQKQPPPPMEVQVEQLKGKNALQLQQAKAQADAQQQQVELQNEQQQLQNGGVSPHIASAQAKIADAQIRARTQELVQAQKNQTDLQQAQIEAQMAREDRQSELQLAAIKRDTLVLELSLKSGMSLQELHAGLADRAAQENTKRQLGVVEAQLTAQESDKQRQHEMNLADHAALNAHIENNNAVIRNQDMNGNT